MTADEDDPTPRSGALGASSPRDLLSGGMAATDAIVPTILFAVLAILTTLPIAAGAALSWCAVVFAVRLRRRQPLTMAASGLGGVLVGVAFAAVAGEATAFFLPGVIGNAIFGVLSVISVVVGRPALAWTSAALYRWPLEWYWHPRVRPAYSEVTMLWAVFYLGKAWWQLELISSDQLALLATVRVATGWPALIGLIGLTYAWVTWRLDALDAPPVEEFRGT